MPALVRIESLGPFFNTLAADDRYSRRNMMNLQQQLQTALSQKQKIFSSIFIAFIKPTLNLEHFDRKCESYSFSISQIIDSEGGGYLNVQNACFRRPFGNQRVQEFQTLSKSARHHYYPIVPWILDKLSWKKCRLVRFEILELFVNTLTTDDKYSVAISRIWPNNFKRLCLKNKRLSIEFLLHMSNLEQVQTIVSKKMSLLA